MTKVAFVAHHERDRAVGVCGDALTWLDDHGHDAWIDAHDAEVLGAASGGSGR